MSQIQLPAAGRWFHRLAAHFSHIVRVQFKISLEEMRHICRRLGAGRPPLYRSPACELQVVRRQLCASTVIYDTRTDSAFLNGHRPVPGSSQLPLYMQQRGHRTALFQTTRFLKAVPRKKLSDLVNFLKILEKHYVSNDAIENAWILSNL
jgi:hypothetical protein